MKRYNTLLELLTAGEFEPLRFAAHRAILVLVGWWGGVSGWAILVLEGGGGWGGVGVW